MQTLSMQESNTKLGNDLINQFTYMNTISFSNITDCINFSGPEKPSFKIIKATANVVGEKRPIVNFTICSQLIKNYVAHKVDRPAELNNKEINAFSYYFDRATEFGLIGKSKHTRVQNTIRFK